VGIELAGDLLGTLIIFQQKLEDERFKSAQVCMVAHGAPLRRAGGADKHGRRRVVLRLRNSDPLEAGGRV